MSQFKPAAVGSAFLAANLVALLSSGVASAQAIPFYTNSGFGPAVPPNANEWGGVNKTNTSVIFEVFIDYTTTVAEATAPFTVFENGADAVGSGVAFDGANILFAVGGSSVANTAVATGPHGLTGGETNVQIVAVLEFGGGTDTNELLSVYVNGALVGTVDGPTGNDWAGVNTSNLGITDSFNIFEYVPSINPNAGNGANGVFAGNYPDDTTNISFAVYELGVGDNTVENILVSPAPESLDFVIVPSATVAGSYDFSWASQSGKVYDLVSSTDLSTAPATWAVWEENSGLSGGNLTEVPGGSDTKRFFAILERDPEP